jgi:threonine/homoserine/homoserine lactone efflux protein
LGVTFAALVLSDELLPEVFRWLSLAGAFYLVWLATEPLLVHRRTSRQATSSRPRKPLRDGLTIAFANPAAVVFYTAFFPQFIDRDDSITGQMTVLSTAYICAAVALDCACVLAVARVRLSGAWAHVSRFAELGSAVVYLSVALIAVLSFMGALG